jgi:hypothetical protein
MTTTTADQIKSGDTVTAEFAGVRYTGPVRSVDPAAFTTARTGVEHRLITFVGGGYWIGQDQSVSIPATQVVTIH